MHLESLSNARTFAQEGLDTIYKADYVGLSAHYGSSSTGTGSG
jgi:hypothetical protein